MKTPVRTMIIAGNWKMNYGPRQAAAFADLNAILGFDSERTYLLTDESAAPLPPPPTSAAGLIAQAFQSVNYPVLPEVRHLDDESRREVLHIRHHSLYAPRDFDVSPFFAIIKPTIETGFDYRTMAWATDEPPPVANAPAQPAK